MRLLFYSFMISSSVRSIPEAVKITIQFDIPSFHFLIGCRFLKNQMSPESL